MKKYSLMAVVLFCYTCLSALNVSLNYGGGFSTTSSTISFNYSGNANTPGVYFGGRITGRIFLVSGSNSYYAGEFHHYASSACSSTTNIVTSPVYTTSIPYQYPTVPFTPCNTSQNVLITVPSSCIPTGTYAVRLDLECFAPGFEFDPNSFPTCDVTIGSTNFPQAITNGFPYAHITNLVLGSAQIGNFTVSSGGTFAVSATGNPTTCSASGSIGINITPGTAPYSIWTQYMGSPTTTASTSTSINIAAGTYPVIVVDANGCRRDLSAVVAPPTQPTVSISKSPVQPPSGYCKNTCVTFTATPSTGTGYTYNWKRNGIPISTNQTFCNIPGAPSTTYSVTISNSFGCVANATQTVTVNNSCTAVTGSCCFGNRREITPLDTTQNMTMELYPNPASDLLNIKLEAFEEQNANIEIIDRTGKVVQIAGISAGTISYTMNVSNLPSGAYVVRIISGDLELISSTFIKE